MLILVSKTVFVSVCTPLIAIYFSASAQLVSSDLLFGHSSKGERRKYRRREAVLNRQDTTSKISAAGRPKYDSHLAGSGRDRRL